MPITPSSDQEFYTGVSGYVELITSEISYLKNLYRASQYINEQLAQLSHKKKEFSEEINFLTHCLLDLEKLKQGSLELLGILEAHTDKKEILEAYQTFLEEHDPDKIPEIQSLAQQPSLHSTLVGFHGKLTDAKFIENIQDLETNHFLVKQSHILKKIHPLFKREHFKGLNQAIHDVGNDPGFQDVLFKHMNTHINYTTYFTDIEKTLSKINAKSLTQISNQGFFITPVQRFLRYKTIWSEVIKVDQTFSPFQKIADNIALISEKGNSHQKKKDIATSIGSLKKLNLTSTIPSLEQSQISISKIPEIQKSLEESSFSIRKRKGLHPDTMTLCDENHKEICHIKLSKRNAGSVLEINMSTDFLQHRYTSEKIKSYELGKTIGFLHTLVASLHRATNEGQQKPNIDIVEYESTISVQEHKSLSEDIALFIDKAYIQASQPILTDADKVTGLQESFHNKTRHDESVYTTVNTHFLTAEHKNMAEVSFLNTFINDILQESDDKISVGEKNLLNHYTRELNKITNSFNKVMTYLQDNAHLGINAVVNSSYFHTLFLNHVRHSLKLVVLQKSMHTTLTTIGHRLHLSVFQKPHDFHRTVTNCKNLLSELLKKNESLQYTLREKDHPNKAIAQLAFSLRSIEQLRKPFQKPNDTYSLKSLQELSKNISTLKFEISVKPSQTITLQDSIFNNIKMVGLLAKLGLKVRTKNPKKLILCNYQNRPIITITQKKQQPQKVIVSASSKALNSLVDPKAKALLVARIGLLAHKLSRQEMYENVTLTATGPGSKKDTQDRLQEWFIPNKPGLLENGTLKHIMPELYHINDEHVIRALTINTRINTFYATQSNHSLEKRIKSLCRITKQDLDLMATARSLPTPYSTYYNAYVQMKKVSIEYLKKNVSKEASALNDFSKAYQVYQEIHSDRSSRTIWARQNLVNAFNNITELSKEYIQHLAKISSTPDAGALKKYKDLHHQLEKTRKELNIKIITAHDSPRATEKYLIPHSGTIVRLAKQYKDRRTHVPLVRPGDGTSLIFKYTKNINSLLKELQNKFQEQHFVIASENGQQVIYALDSHYFQTIRISLKDNRVHLDMQEDPNRPTLQQNDRLFIRFVKKATHMMWDVAMGLNPKGPYELPLQKETIANQSLLYDAYERQVKIQVRNPDFSVTLANKDIVPKNIHTEIVRPLLLNHLVGVKTVLSEQAKSIIGEQTALSHHPKRINLRNLQSQARIYEGARVLLSHGFTVEVPPKLTAKAKLVNDSCEIHVHKNYPSSCITKVFQQALDLNFTATLSEEVSQRILKEQRHLTAHESAYDISITANTPKSASEKIQQVLKNGLTPKLSNKLKELLADKQNLGSLTLTQTNPHIALYQYKILSTLGFSINLKPTVEEKIKELVKKSPQKIAIPARPNKTWMTRTKQAKDLGLSLYQKKKKQSSSSPIQRSTLVSKKVQ